MSDWREPITDRTLTDVKNADTGSLEYQKGALNADDLNRIEDNYKYLMAKLKSDAIFIPHRLRDFTETVLEYVQTGEVGQEYTLVEYIESSGTQYIDLEIVPDKNTRVEVEFQLVDAPTSNYCVMGTVGQFSFRWYGASGVFRSNGANTADFPNTIDALAWHNVVKTSTICTIDDTYSVTNTVGTVEMSPYLFAQHTATGASNYSKDRKKAVRVYRSDALILDLISVLDVNGVACMYDKVSQTYFYNAGTGTFTAGPEVPVETDPVYELIETQTTYTDWQENNLPWLSEINRIRANYNALVRLFLVGLGFSEQAESNYLDYTEVNNWERIADVGKTMFENMEKEYRYCGMEESGGDVL